MLRQLAKSGANFIIAHASGYDTVAARIAQQYKVPIMTYDIPTMLLKGYVSNITTQSQEGSYLAGHPRRTDDEDTHGRHRHLRL